MLLGVLPRPTHTARPVPAHPPTRHPFPVQGTTPALPPTRSLLPFPVQGTILPGVTRRSIIELARERGYTVEEAPVSVHEAMEADELFTTGTAVSVTARVAGRPGWLAASLAW